MLAKDGSEYNDRKKKYNFKRFTPGWRGGTRPWMMKVGSDTLFIAPVRWRFFLPSHSIQVPISSNWLRACPYKPLSGTVLSCSIPPLSLENSPSILLPASAMVHPQSLLPRITVIGVGFAAQLSFLTQSFGGTECHAYSMSVFTTSDSLIGSGALR